MLSAAGGCSDSSRSYPGRSAWPAIDLIGSALYGNMWGDRAEVSPPQADHSRCWRNEPRPGNPEDIAEDSPRRRTEHRAGKEPL